jgi:hypothetical protein
LKDYKRRKIMKCNLFGLITFALFITMAGTQTNAQISKLPKIPPSESKAGTPSVVVGVRHLAYGRKFVNPHGFTNCVGLGELALNGFQNVRILNGEVNGHYGTNYAAITCFDTPSGKVAYIAVTGYEKRGTDALRDAIRARFSNASVPLPAKSDVGGIFPNYFYWSTPTLRVKTMTGCLNNAQYTLGYLFRQAEPSTFGFDVRLDDRFITVTCVDTKFGFKGIVMVVGSNEQKTVATRDKIAIQMAETDIPLEDDIDRP